MKRARGTSPIPNISRLSAAMRRAIVDTGPLVAFLDRAEQHHPWVIEQIDELQPPLLVCEPVLAARFPRGQDALFGLLENGAAHFRKPQRANQSLNLCLWVA
jgi:hypothetical protein